MATYWPPPPALSSIMLSEKGSVGNCLVPVWRFLSPSRSIRFGDVSEANGRETPRQKQNEHACVAFWNSKLTVRNIPKFKDRAKWSRHTACSTNERARFWFGSDINKTAKHDQKFFKMADGSRQSIVSLISFSIYRKLTVLVVLHYFKENIWFKKIRVLLIARNRSNIPGWSQRSWLHRHGK